EAKTQGVHVDHHAMWINPADHDHVRLGNDGGFYETHDRGEHWQHHNISSIGQFYHAECGPGRDYMVVGGLQDNGSWAGPSVVRSGNGPTNQDWFRVGGGDGFRCLIDPDDANQIYFESQNGGLGRRHLESGQRGGIRPGPPGARYRFNWNTPFLLSNHNSRIFYAAGNHVFRSLMRGQNLERISPEITRTDKGSATALAESPLDAGVLFVGTDDGALWRSKDGGHAWQDVFTIDKTDPVEESKDEPGELDPEQVQRMRQGLMRYDENKDGQLSTDELPERFRAAVPASDANKTGSLEDTEITHFVEALIRSRSAADGRRGGLAPSEPTPGGKPLNELLPDAEAGRRYVSWIETSRARVGRVYLVLDGHRSDDDRALLFVSEDHGSTWRSLVGDLPASAGTTRVLREDTKNHDLLFLGTELGAWFSIDRGIHWHRLASNLPTVAVHYFAIQDTAEELLITTHGRSLWIMDLSLIRQFNPETLAAASHLFQPKPAVMWRPDVERGDARDFVGDNPPDGAQFAWSLAADAKTVELKVETPDGTLVRSFDELPLKAGLHLIGWNLRGVSSDARNRVGPRVQPGNYRLTLTVDGTAAQRTVVVTGDPAHPDNSWIAAENAAEEEEAENGGDEEERERHGSRGDVIRD
ncbi:MAG: hypothetical protein AB7S36_18185, partial [Planctomycetota bacterium]